MRGVLAWLHVALGSIALLGIVAMPAKAHHGGLGIEGDIIAEVAEARALEPAG